MGRAAEVHRLYVSNSLWQFNSIIAVTKPYKNSVVIVLRQCQHTCSKEEKQRSYTSRAARVLRLYVRISV